MRSRNLSKLSCAAKDGIKSSIVRQGASVQDRAEGLVRQGRLLLGNCSFLQPVMSSSFPSLNGNHRYGCIYSGRIYSGLNQGHGALSSIFASPSVYSPSHQFCGYHIDLSLSVFTKSIFNVMKPKIIMAASGTKAALSDCTVGKWSSNQDNLKVSRNSATTLICIKGPYYAARMCLKNSENSNHLYFYGYVVYNAARSRYACKLDSWSGWNNFFHSVPTSQTVGTASYASSDSFSHEEAMSNTSSNRQISVQRTLKLLSGSFYLPHPDKQETGGEDAHFICEEEQAIGVADGVGGWADVGINAGIYAQELMANSVNAIREEPKGYIDPARVLEKAHSGTKVRGSSTACIIALNNEGLHAINLGDSGFVVVRDGCTVFRSPAQQHDFNFTYQLENGTGGDLPSAGQVFIVSVAPGDVLIAGTDGLFDNLYHNEVTAVVVHAKRAGFGPQVAAQKIAALARERAKDKNRQTPFSTAAQEAGFRYHGGKLDDITVVVSYIISSTASTDV